MTHNDHLMNMTGLVENDSQAILRGVEDRGTDDTDEGPIARSEVDPVTGKPIRHVTIGWIMEHEPGRYRDVPVKRWGKRGKGKN